ncbi:MAG: rod shape-determining protein [Clostridiales bacterium]|nr:rod shape-determining protein [Clostridiales bacterium]
MWGTQDIGIDLGTASVLVYVKGRGIVLREPSVVAVDERTGRTLAVGEEARRMLGRTPGTIKAIRPLRDGVISDYHVTETMLRYFLDKVVGKKFFFKPRVVVCVPSGVTEVEKRSVIEATEDAGAREVDLIEEPIAAAIGAGIDISRPYGSMIVDIGGGTTDIAVISLNSTVVSSSIKLAGDKFDEAIIRYMRKKHNLLIGERTAEDLKINIGAAFPRKETIFMEVTGRNLVSGLPKTVNVGSDEMIEALDEPVQAVLEAVHDVLERTPPEISSDIFDRGIVMTGGGSLLYGLDMRIQQYTRVPCFVAEDAVSCVAIGTGKALENIDALKKHNALFTTSRRGSHQRNI